MDIEWDENQTKNYHNKFLEVFSKKTDIIIIIIINNNNNTNFWNYWI